MGSYGDGAGWEEIHCTPEQAIRAHNAVKGKTMIPTHWGTFAQAMHAWNEPIERFIRAAEVEGIDYLTPMPGEYLNPGHIGGKRLWWREYVTKVEHRNGRNVQTLLSKLNQ